MQTQDIHFMQAALREAKKGVGRTSPNPAVGAVVVKDGKIVGKGYHRKAGTPHAEIHALHNAGSAAHKSTLYVTLEPCNHVGRTPPCTQAILRSGIKRVIVGMIDPNPLVAGGGIIFLKNQGVEVISGVLAEQCEEINRPFVKHITTGLPWVMLKAGISLDGKIATRTGQSSWITNELSRRKVHQLRDHVDAILIGSGTAIHDNPSLTTRLPHRKGKDPMRVILDTKLRTSEDALLLTQKSSAPTVLFCRADADPRRVARLEQAGAIIKPIAVTKDENLDLAAVLQELGKMQILSVLVEGGSRVHGSFLRAGLVDQIFMFIAPILIGGDGISVSDALGFDVVQEAIHLKEVTSRKFGDNILIEGRL